MSLSNVEAINTLHGLVLPVGTGICRNCRKLLLDGQNKAVNKSINQEKIANKILDENNFAEVHYKQTRKLYYDVPTSQDVLIYEIDQVTALDDSGPIKRTRQTITVESDPCSILEETCSQETCESEQVCLSQISESSICNSMKLEPLNSLLSFSGLSPVKELQGQKSDASRRTQQRYIEKARQCLDVMCNTICPGAGEFLKSALLIEDETDQSEKVTLEVLVEIYKRADTWDSQRQILSIIADQHSFDDVKKLIPDVTQYKFKAAKKHCKEFGTGEPVKKTKQTREKFDTDQLEHFIEFITSGHIIKDQPFGEKTLKLTNGEIIKIPSVIRNLAP